MSDVKVQCHREDVVVVANLVTPIPVRRALVEFGHYVRAWRSLRGLTQDVTADRAGCTRPTLSKIERGDGGVRWETVVSVARALGILTELVGSIDPLRSDLGRLRVTENIPHRVRTPKR